MLTLSGCFFATLEKENKLSSQLGSSAIFLVTISQHSGPDKYYRNILINHTLKQSKVGQNFITVVSFMIEHING